MRPDRDAVAREWRASFVRDATVTVLSRIRKTSTDEIWREIRAPSTPLKVGDYPGGGVAKVMLLAPKSTIAQLSPLATTVDLVGISSFEFFPSPSNFGVATFIGEGQPIPVRQGAFVGMPVGPVRKLALLAGLSSELELASGGIAETVIIGHTIEVAVGRGGDGVLLSSNAATADAPAGLLFGAATVGGSADMTKDLCALIASISAAGIDTASVVFVCAPSQALAISLRAGPHFAHRIIEASTLAAGTVVAVATAGLVFAGDGGNPKIDISKQAVLNFADPASQIVSAAGVVAAPTLSTLQQDLLTLRCIARITWSAAPGSVAVIQNSTW